MLDKDLLEAIALKDESAFNTFYDRYERLLYEWAYRRTGDIDLTNEITQNFWISVWSKPLLIKTDAEGMARKFLLHHYTYRMLDYLKSAHLKPAGGENRLDMDEVEAKLPYSHIEEEFDFKEINAVINDILQMLPQIDREVVALIWHEELSVKEVAIQLNIDERTVGYKSKRGLSFLKKNIGKLYNITDSDKTEDDNHSVIGEISSG